jgi:23S rRNA pseudouridine2605 synthase
MTESSERLNKFLALHLGVSRREADDMIQAGRVSVNGKAPILGTQVSPGDDVSADGKPVGRIEYRYVAFNKPVGYVCSRRAQGDNPTIYDLLPEDMRSLKPVGRLDRDSSGLLILTNDGDFAHTMTHPSFHKVKSYEISLDKPLEPLHHQMIVDHGIEIDDGTSKLALERRDDSRLHWIVTMSEGRNRQIRRTFAALGYEVTTLHRTLFGPYRLDALATGVFEDVDRVPSATR